MAFTLDDRFIKAAEQSNGSQFPQSYADFMRKTNGGTTADDSWLLHPIEDTSDRTRIKRTCNHVLRETAKARRYERLPEGAVVIGEDMENTLLLLLPDSSDAGQLGTAVYGWHPFHQDLHEVVSDFSEFASEGGCQTVD